MSGLDILTPRGQRTVEDERKAVELFVSRYPRCSYIHTKKDKPARFDAILVAGGEVRGIVETKCRYKLSLDKFQGAFKNEWLITYEKIEADIMVARAMDTPLLGFLYLADYSTLLWKKIWSPEGGANFEIEVTRTQATVNGGSAVRPNAFIKMDDAEIITAQ